MVSDNSSLVGAVSYRLSPAEAPYLTMIVTWVLVRSAPSLAIAVST